MKRYDEISKLFEDELDYTLVWRGKDDIGNDNWVYQKGDEKLEFNEKTLEEHYYCSSTLHMNSLKRAEKLTNNLIFENWKEHRRIDGERKGGSQLPPY
jgi:hypothetical protein